MKITIPKNDWTKTLYDLIKSQYPNKIEQRFWDDYVDMNNVWTNSIFINEIHNWKNINIDDSNENDEIWVNEIHLFTFWTISDLYMYSKDVDWKLEVRISKKVQ